mmetsp:Transcript_21855/g.70606  ORF Transcript_21855/g.70606 Transcript_21855/m.70606 type:complete len:285 (-) Transcript_21855:72-926(-)|eukprot:CAMPEP_0170145104 /NCGR_PEP_ID=MMETSP0033_2-20121228/16336_1 /TAXON_ID=195969 /ORGANISM="Dolichomastix tenuilepis, Strain CCMP3274" /LENGTH=284 /DNA_ID=CAMNT_0010381639 /DNA_START=147 /DNA_END=1001 /DNA_ORIENTATION=-
MFSVVNNFYIGAYQAAVNEASSLSHLDGTEATERDCFLYRSYIALGSPELALAEIGDDASTALQAVKLWARYKSDPSSKEAVLNQLQELMADPSCAANTTLQLMAATVYACEDNQTEALRCCHGGASLELMALSVQCLLKMNRVDLAEKQLRAMSSTDDDATLTQLATAWVNIGLGGSKLQEAQYVFQELGEKYAWTPKLHNGAAVCHLQMGQYDEAERELLEALNKDSKDPDTLANLVIASVRVGKPSARFSAQLKTVAPSHHLLARLAAHEDGFERAAAAVN